MNLKLFLLGVLVSSQTVAAHIPLRCKTWGDSLETKQAIERREWAWKCFPTFRGMIQFHEQLLDELTQQLTEGYPTFGLSTQDGKIINPTNWLAPSDRNADCSVPEGYMIVSYCGAGCYTPEQKILFKDGPEDIGKAYEENLLEVITLDSISELNSLKFTSSLVESYITDLVSGTHDVLVFHMLSGGSLRVTHEHPLVDSEGRMRSAISLKIGEALVMANGDFDPIISIEAEEYVGKVYNLDVISRNPAEKIIVAQGYLNGTTYFQNKGLREINRVILRTNLISDSVVQ